jgi:Fic family protein
MSPKRLKGNTTLESDQPYDALPDLPPAVEVESRKVLKACIEARAKLAALKEACGLIPNAEILIIAIPLLEAQASSEIENIVTTTDALFRYSQFEEQAVDPATKEALRYRAALREGFEDLKKRPVTSATAIHVCSRIKHVEMEIRRVPGTALKNAVTGEVIYTPPLGEALLRKKLANWERFIHQEETIDPLIKMAIAHYQFEAIHPFTDGNGRTGRILNLLILIEQGLLDLPVLYLSRYIIRNRDRYYRLLQAVTSKGDWESWILYMLDAVAEMASWTTMKIHSIRQLHAITKEHLRERTPRIYSHELLDVIFVQPYCRIQNLVSDGIAQRQAASVYLKALVEVGVLKEVKMGKEKLFLHPKLMNLLTNEENTVRPYPGVSGGGVGLAG